MAGGLAQSLGIELERLVPWLWMTVLGDGSLEAPFDSRPQTNKKKAFQATDNQGGHYDCTHMAVISG